MRRVGAAIAVLIAIFALGIGLPDIARIFGSPLYYFGYTFDATGSVIKVDAGSGAAAAGIIPGDRLDLHATPPEMRAAFLAGLSAIPHAQITLGLVHDGIERMLTVSANTPEPPYDRPLVLAREFAAVVYIVVGVALVLLRPSLMTWGFFLFCCAFSPAPFAVFATTFSFPVTFAAGLFDSVILLTAGVIGLDIFGLRFPSGEGRGWRTVAERICLFAALPLAALFAYRFYELFVVGSLTAADRITTPIISVFVTLAIVGLIGTYRVAGGADRSRMQWVIFGSAASLLAFGFEAFLPPGAPYWMHAVSLFSTIAMPLAVAYAVIRHRIIDVNFVVSRALVFAVLTSLLVGVFTLVDWLLGKVLEQTRLTLAVETAVALALGFWLNGLHRRVDQLIDRVLFRQRYRAARQLTRAAAGLPHADSAQTVDEMLVAEPVDALGLASAAVFRLRDGGGYAREASANWPELSARTLDQSEQLVLQLKGERGPLPLDEIRWPRRDLPDGDKAPILAVPVIVRDRLFAIALYGAHVNGEALDPDEVPLIGRLAAGAAVAYDHLDAEALRSELEHLRALHRSATVS